MFFYKYITERKMLFYKYITYILILYYCMSCVRTREAFFIKR